MEKSKWTKIALNIYIVLDNRTFHRYVNTGYFKLPSVLFLLQISTVTGELRYADALRLLYTLEDASKVLVYIDSENIL